MPDAYGRGCSYEIRTERHRYMFKFMAMTAAMLPNMEMDTGLFRLKVDDGGIFFEINHPFRKRKQRDISNDCCAEEPDNYDDDEEGLIYDGD